MPTTLLPRRDAAKNGFAQLCDDRASASPRHDRDRTYRRLAHSEICWTRCSLAAGSAGFCSWYSFFFSCRNRIQFLALRKPEAPELRRMVQSDRARNAHLICDTILCAPGTKERGFALAQLFGVKHRVATTLLWIAYFTEGLTYITIAAWLAVVLETAGLAADGSSLTFSYAAAGGILVSLLLMRRSTRFGPMDERRHGGHRDWGDHHLGHAGIPTWLIIASAIGVHSFCSATHSSLNGTVGLSIDQYPLERFRLGSGLGRIASMIGRSSSAISCRGNCRCRTCLSRRHALCGA